MNSTVPSRAAKDGADLGPGLFRRTWDDGASVITNVRLAGQVRRAGTGMINAATSLLFVLAIGLFAVSLDAQYRYILTEKHDHVVSLIEAVSLDAGMIIFTLLALGLARAGKSATIERALILACALGSAGMNFAAANVVSPRSVAAYVVPPLFLAVVVDRVVAVIRRHVLGDEEATPFASVGTGALYFTRFLLAPVSTARGARQAVLDATPVPAPAPKPLTMRPCPVIPITRKPEVINAEPIMSQAEVDRNVAAWTKPRVARKSTPKRAITSGPSKTSQFLELVTAEHGALSAIDPGNVYGISKALAPKVGLHEGSARTALRKAILAAQAGGAR